MILDLEDYLLVTLGSKQNSDEMLHMFAELVFRRSKCSRHERTTATPLKIANKSFVVLTLARKWGPTWGGRIPKPSTHVDEKYYKCNTVRLLFTFYILALCTSIIKE